MISMRTFATLVASVSLLAACGGGGGGGGGGSGNPNPPPPAGAFTLSASTASFYGIQGLPLPAEQVFTMTVTGSKVAAVGAAYANGQTPASWLNISMTGAGSTYQLHVGVFGAGAGTQTASFTVGTADASGNILQTRVFTVTYTLDMHLEAEASIVQHDFQFGDSVRVETWPVTVTRVAGRQWNITSNAAWLVPPATTQTGDGTADVTIDVTGLAPAFYAGVVRVANTANPAEFLEIPVNVFIRPASFSVTQESVDFGGPSGTAALDPMPVNFKLNTGQGVHPFTASVTTDSGGNWLSVDQAGGTVGSAGATVNLDVDTSQLVGGTYTGEVTISTNVYGTVFTEMRPVTLNLEANRIVVTASGVALSSVGGRNVLTRTLKVVSAVGKTDTPWSAVSDQPWLAVTAAGVTGGNLVLTATPGALAKDVTHFANVTINSSDPKVENGQSVRVGLYLSDTAPVDVDFSGLRAMSMAASPVEPLVAIAATDTTGLTAGTFGLYNVYSGALVRPIIAAVLQRGAMKFSEDGRTLFIHDKTLGTVVEVDVATGDYVRAYNAGPNGGLEGTALAVMHPNGYPIVVVPNGRAYELETHTELPHQNFNGTFFVLASNTDSYAVSPDQSLLVPHWGTPVRVVRTALDGGGLRGIWPGVNSPVGSVNGDACISGSGDHLYSTSDGNGGVFARVDIATEQIDLQLPVYGYPVALQCVWNGLVVAGESSYYTDHDIQVFYGPDSTELTQLSSNGDAVFSYRLQRSHQLVVSGDGTRVMSGWDSGPGQYTDGIYLQDLPTPP